MKKGRQEIPKYTVMLHEVRIGLDISLVEYCVADMITKLMGNPKSKAPGWCYATQARLAEFLGVTDRTIRSAESSLAASGLLEKDRETGHKRTTQKWYDEVVLVRGKHFRIEEKASAQRRKGFPLEEEKASAPSDSNSDKNKDKHTKCVTEGFDVFWEEYPRKVSKVVAERSFRRLAPSKKLMGEILADVRQRKEGDDWQKEGGRFVPHPATYLNQRRWEDETKPGTEDIEIPEYHKKFKSQHYAKSR